VQIQQQTATFDDAKVTVARQMTGAAPSAHLSLMRKIVLLDAVPLATCLALLWLLSGSKPNAATIPFKPATTDEALVSSIVTAMTPDAPEAKDSIAEASAKPGKKAKRRYLSSSVLHPHGPDTIPYLSFDPMMLQAMYEQANYLRRSDTPARGASGITKAEMLRTVELLQSVQLLDPNVLLTTFDFYSINTDLNKDRVRVTGYYTPLIKASRTQAPDFQYPMLAMPESDVPSPAAIDAGALAGRGLELAWLSSRKELSNAQLQGSCLVEFPDGKREHFGFGGSRRGDGGAYVFFKRVDDKVLGAGFFPLTAGYSVAVDTRYIPIGSTLLAELPNIDAAGRLRGYIYRIVFAQDKGGAIKTTKRIDLYCGMGQKGLQEARKINRFGRLWLLLPKER
jgi:membrane-bound lytic murein transglycosylase A